MNDCVSKSQVRSPEGEVKGEAQKKSGKKTHGVDVQEVAFVRTMETLHMSRCEVQG